MEDQVPQAKTERVQILECKSKIYMARKQLMSFIWTLIPSEEIHKNRLGLYVQRLPIFQVKIHHHAFKDLTNFHLIRTI